MKPGIHQISMSEYLALKALSSGLCHTLLTYSPYHAKWEQDNRPDDPSIESDIGTAIHEALLEGRDRIVEIEADDWRSKAAREARDAVRAAGKIPMLARTAALIEPAVSAAKAYIASSEIAGVLDAGKPEETLIWQEGAVTCKARPDWLDTIRPLMLHVKTTGGSAEPNSWIRNQLVPSGYDVSMAFYERGFYQLMNGDNSFQLMNVFLVIEQQEPHGCSLIGLDPAMRDLAAKKADRAIRTWRECQLEGRWPCYPTRIAYAEPKSWQMEQEEQATLIETYDRLQEKHGLQP